MQQTLATQRRAAAARLSKCLVPSPHTAQLRARFPTPAAAGALPTCVKMALVRAMRVRLAISPATNESAMDTTAQPASTMPR